MPIIKRHQTFADFVTQHAGSMNDMFNVALLNGISISDQPLPGTAMQVVASDLKVTAFYIKSGLDITGGLPVGPNINGGIGYMQIGNDFKVS